jgi:lysyl-tRNA synthetase class 1
VPALTDLVNGLLAAPAQAGAQALQTVVYDVGKSHPDVFPSLKDWFRALYQIILGQDEGPRMGSFIALYGIDETVRMLSDIIAGAPAETSGAS